MYSIVKKYLILLVTSAPLGIIAIGKDFGIFRRRRKTIFLAKITNFGCLLVDFARNFYATGDKTIFEYI